MDEMHKQMYDAAIKTIQERWDDKQLDDVIDSMARVILVQAEQIQEMQEKIKQLEARNG